MRGFAIRAACLCNYFSLIHFVKVFFVHLLLVDFCGRTTKAFISTFAQQETEWRDKEKIAGSRFQASFKNTVLDSTDTEHKYQTIQLNAHFGVNCPPLVSYSPIFYTKAITAYFERDTV